MGRYGAGTSIHEDTGVAATEACNQAAKGCDGAVDLALVFVSPHHAERLGDVASVVAARFAPRVLLGCTGEGIIGSEQEFERQPAVTVWVGRLPGVTLTPFHVSFRRMAEGIGVDGWPEGLPEEPKPVFVLLADPFSTPGSEFLAFLEQASPGARAVGGMASGGAGPGENRLVLDGTVVIDGVVGVALSGDVEIVTVVSQGCRPIGERFLITKADGNVIYELGGRPAFTCLQEVYAALPPEEQEMARRGLHIGLTINESKAQFDRGDFLVRGLMGVDQQEGSLSIGDLVKEGQTIQFHLRDRETASEDFNVLLESHKQEFADILPEAALVFSCNGRGRRLFGRPHHDVTTVRAHLGDLPVSGFFAQGEIGPVGGENFLHGFTASVAIFCASERSPSSSAPRGSTS
ncbi:MAG: FIST N-terminal domain-containing protein [Nitrospiria bacterium]